MRDEPLGPVDVAVIGGGPAGATVATFLALRGRNVALFEKDKHPRFHIGESCLPKNLPIFERLGIGEEIKAIGVYKPGAEFVSPDHDARQVFQFTDALDPNPPNAYQVERAQFDEILIRNARHNGALVTENCGVTDVDFDTDGCRLALANNGAFTECRARFLVDASGRNGFLANRQGTRRRNKTHNSAAMFAHFVDVPREAWSQQGNLAIYWFEHGWIWMIPLQEGLTSVGAVCMPDYLKRRKGPLSDFFVETLRLCPTAWRVLSAASRATSVRAAGNYSYKADRAYGNGYLLLGDAYAFVDPVFSSGVYLAMSGAELAAAAIDECLDHPERAAVRFRQFQRQVDRGIKRFSWFIYRFNTPAMRGLFMRPRNILGVRKAVISLLAGDVYRGGGLTWRLAIFKLLYFASLFIHYRGSRRWENRRRRMRLISMPQDDIIEE